MVGLATNLSFILLGEDKTASKTMDAAAAKAEQTTGRIGSAFSKVGGIIGGEFGGILGEVGDGVDKLGSKAAKLSTGLMVGGGIGVAAGIGLAKFGSGATQASDQLNAAITATGSASSDYADKIEEAVKKGEDFDHSAIDTKGALTILTQQTQDTGKALDKMGIVTDLAAAKHISLSDAASLVARIMSGSGARTLTQYGIHLDGVGTKTQQGERALQALSARLDGQAKASVNNFGSQVDIAKTKVTDWAEEMAGPAGGALTALGGVATVTGLAMDIYKARQDAAAVAALATTTATEAETVAVGELDVAMDANPIGLVAGGLAVLAGIAGGIALGSTRDLTQATKDYTTALDLDNQMIGKNVEAKARKALLDDGSLAAAKKLGISTYEVVQAALGNKKAQEDVDVALQGVITRSQEQAAANVANAGSAAQKRAAEKENAASQRAVRAEVDLLTGSIHDNSVELQNAKTSNDLLNGSMANDVPKSAAAAGLAFDTLTGKVQAYSDARNTAHSPTAPATRPVTGGAKARAGGGDVHMGGLTLVGEQGPELMYVPPATKVWSSGTSPSSASSSGAIININVQSGLGTNPSQVGKDIISAMVTTLRSGGSSATELRHALGL